MKISSIFTKRTTITSAAITHAVNTAILTTDAIPYEDGITQIVVQAHVTFIPGSAGPLLLILQRGADVSGYQFPIFGGASIVASGAFSSLAGTWFDQPFSTTTYQYTLSIQNNGADNALVVSGATIVVFTMTP